MSEPDYSGGERRPIKSRELGASQRAAAWLVAAGVSANAISVAGMVVGLLAGGALATTAQLTGPALVGAWVAGALFTQLRLLANMLDGMVALASGQASPLGELYNEVPDRIADTAILLGLGYALGGHVLLGFAASLAAMFTAYIRAMGKAAGAPHQFCGPMAKPHRMFIVTLVALYMAAAPADWPLAAATATVWALPALALGLITVGSVGTALRRLGRTARILNP